MTCSVCGIYCTCLAENTEVSMSSSSIFIGSGFTSDIVSAPLEDHSCSWSVRG